jgi:hypothetical protein
MRCHGGRHVLLAVAAVLFHAAGTDAPAPESEALPVGGARLGTHPGCIPRTRPASVQ